MSQEILEAFIEAVKPHLNVAVIYGGDKHVPGAVLHETANTRPWKSYEQVARAIAETLERVGFRHVTLVPDDMHLGERLRAAGTHLAWLNTGGMQGRNPMAHTPALLESWGVPYVGHDPLNVSRLDNKHVFKRELASLGIASPAFMLGSATLPFAAQSAEFHQAFGSYPGPFIVKPVSGRGSVQVHAVADVGGLAAAVAEVQATTHAQVLIERFVGGREFCVAVMGGTVCRARQFTVARAPFAFSVVERILGPGHSIAPPLDRIAPEARLLDDTDADIRERLLALGRRVYEAFDLECLTRLDLRFDAHGELHVLEANPKPDLGYGPHNRSLVGVGLADAGMDDADLILSLLGDRLRRLRAGQDLGHPSLLELASGAWVQRSL